MLFVLYMKPCHELVLAPLTHTFSGFILNPEYCVLCLTKRKKEQSFCSIISDMLQGKLVQIWLTAANSPQPSRFESALSVSSRSNMKAYKTSVYLLLAGFLCLHYGSMQSQLRLCSLTHWAIHYRWQRLQWKLAAVLPLGKRYFS